MLSNRLAASFVHAPAGNINQLIIKLDSYAATLDRTQGRIVEFVNPKYADDSRTAFKSSTRLECMMQDFPRELPDDAKVGYTSVNQVKHRLQHLQLAGAWLELGGIQAGTFWLLLSKDRVGALAQSNLAEWVMPACMQDSCGQLLGPEMALETYSMSQLTLVNHQPQAGPLRLRSYMTQLRPAGVGSVLSHEKFT